MGIGLFFPYTYMKNFKQVFLSKIVSEYDQEIPQSQTADKPVTSWEILTEGFENDLADALPKMSKYFNRLKNMATRGWDHLFLFRYRDNFKNILVKIYFADWKWFNTYGHSVTI